MKSWYKKILGGPTDLGGLHLPFVNLVAHIKNVYPFTDRVGKHDGPAQLRQFAEVTSGTVTLYHPAITGAETITSSWGDAPVSVVAGGIVIGVGKAWSIKDNAGHHWSHCAALSAMSVVMWDVSDKREHLIAVGLTEAVVTALCSTSRVLAVGTDWLDHGFTVSGDVYQVARLSNGSRKLPDDTIVPALEDGSACAGYIFTGELFPENAILHYDADVEPLAEITGGIHTLNHAVLSPQYQRNADGGYTDVGSQPAIDVFADGFKGLRSCGAITNLLPGDTSTARSVTLTAQKYTLQVFGHGSVSCSYGSSTVGAPLTFTATAGATTFTPSGATLWILTATDYPTPYVPPGVTQPASNGTTTNGTWFAVPRDSPLWQALSGAPLTLAVRFKLGGSRVDMAASSTANVINCSAVAAGVIFLRGSSPSGTRSFDGSTAAIKDHTWSRDNIFKSVVQINSSGNRFRSGYMIEGIHTAMQWSHPGEDSATWAAYDGSYNPTDLYRLIFGYLNTYPMWLNKLTTWKLQLSDAEILEAWA